MAQTFWSGNGGYITVNGVQLHIKKWTLRKTARVVENTNSAKTATNFEKVVPHYEAQVELPWDADNIPDTDVGLNEGTKLDITFYLGRSSKSETLSGTIVETLEDVNDNETDIIRSNLTCKGGTLTRAIT